MGIANFNPLQAGQKVLIKRSAGNYTYGFVVPHGTSFAIAVKLSGDGPALTNIFNITQQKFESSVPVFETFVHPSWGTRNPDGTYTAQ